MLKWMVKNNTKDWTYDIKKECMNYAKMNNYKETIEWLESEKN